MREASTWIQETVSAKRDESDESVQKHLNDFDQLKNDQKQMVKLLSQYAKQQQALKQTEASLALLLTEMGHHENSTSIRECLTVSGQFFGRMTKHREDLAKSSEATASALENFSATAIEDLKLSVRKYDSARREFLAAEKTASRSKSVATNPERRELMQSEMDEVTNSYRRLSWQVSQKARILSHHRSREVCIKMSDLMEAEIAFAAAAAETMRTAGWRPYVPDEREANELISECYAQEAPAPIVSIAPGFRVPPATPPPTRRPAQEWSGARDGCLSGAQGRAAFSASAASVSPIAPNAPDAPVASVAAVASIASRASRRDRRRRRRSRAASRGEAPARPPPPAPLPASAAAASNPRC